MGCCFSTPNTTQNQTDLKNQLRSHAPKPNVTHEVNSRNPPPQPVEEEFVKEVLSETPISKPQQVSILMTESNTQMPKIENRKVPIINKACSMSESFSDEASQISETCTISESFSTTTTTATTVATVTEKREDEATSKRSTGTQNRNRSQPKRAKAVGGRERRSNSPARMPDKRIPSSSPPIRLRESGQVRCDPGDGSRRRSKSPSSVRTVSTGSGRRQMKPTGGAGRRLPPAKCVEKENDEKENGVVRQEESIENPHVSLECFIFL